MNIHFDAVWYVVNAPVEMIDDAFTPVPVLLSFHTSTGLNQNMRSRGEHAVGTSVLLPLPPLPSQ